LLDQHTPIMVGRFEYGGGQFGGVTLAAACFALLPRWASLTASTTRWVFSGVTSRSTAVLARRAPTPFAPLRMTSFAPIAPS